MFKTGALAYEYPVTTVRYCAVCAS